MLDIRCARLPTRYSHGPFTGYKIYFPFTVNRAPQSPSGNVNASYIYNVAAGFYGTDSTDTDHYVLNYNVYVDDSSGNITNLVNEDNKFGTSLNWQGIKQISTEPGHEIDLKSSCYYWNTPTGTFNQNMKWYVQFLYNGFVNIFN